MQVVVDSLLTNYQDSGKGPVLLMLHGWGSDSTVFKDLNTHFSKKYRVIAPDLPGFGASEKPKEAWDLKSYAEFLANFLKKVKAEPQVILAHSNGAAIAIKGLAENVLETEKLVLLGGAGIRPKKTARKIVLQAVAKSGRVATLILPREKRLAIRNNYYKKINSDYRLMQGMEDTFRKITGEDVLRAAHEIPAPTLLIYGEKDEATPPLFGRLYHEAFQNSQLEIIGGAGHFVFIDEPTTAIKMIEDFLG